ncbi:MAG: hypothetical protein WD200_02575 [Candidatus Andersenbacteria bacterium]
MNMNRYCYSRELGKQELHLSITPSDLRVIHNIDREFLEGILVAQELSKTSGGGWTGRCPFCDGTRKRRKSQESYRPAYITAREQGFVFHCCACDTTLTTYKLLESISGEEKAQEYSTRRWKAGELCGGGFNCPMPQSVKKDLLDAKEKRREEHRKMYEERRLLNYQKKYAT